MEIYSWPSTVILKLQMNLVTRKLDFVACDQQGRNHWASIKCKILPHLHYMIRIRSCKLLKNIYIAWFFPSDFSICIYRLKLIVYMCIYVYVYICVCNLLKIEILFLYALSAVIGVYEHATAFWSDSGFENLGFLLRYVDQQCDLAQTTSVWSSAHFKSIWAATWDFQQCGMCNQQGLRSACVYTQSDQSLCKSLEYSISVKLLTEHNLEFLSLKGGCRGCSESTHVKMPHCWKSHALSHISSNTVWLEDTDKPGGRLIEWIVYEFDKEENVEKQYCCNSKKN